MDFDRVTRARELLRGVASVSRMVTARSLEAETGATVLLKLECEQPTGSFKVRGAYYTLLQRLQRGDLRGAVTSSTGNHGAAVAYAARLLGIPARIFLPVEPNPAKRAVIAQYRAEIVEAGAFREKPREHAAHFARASGWWDIVDGVEPDLTVGTATIGCEIAEQMPAVDVIFVPVGDSTLIRGVARAAKHLRPQVRISGVQAERAPAYVQSFREKRAISTQSSDTIADGLAVRESSESNVREILAFVDERQLVSDEHILRAVRYLLLTEHIVTEPAGAATTAALWNTGRRLAGKNVVNLVTGANISDETLASAMATR